MTKRKLRLLKHNPKTVALIGMGPSMVDIWNETLTQEMMPDFADEFWAINMAANICWHDVVFWMDDLKKQEAFKPGLFALLRRRGQPVITSKAYPSIVPASYDYPLDEISRISIPVLGKPYLTNGVAMAIGYALWKGVKLLKIYGCDFTYPNREYAESGRACVEAWITLASMKGMTIALCQNTSLLDTVRDQGIYGYSEQPEIDLGGGKTFRYLPQELSATYVPEDSSGKPAKKVKDEVQRSVPRAKGNAAKSDGAGKPAAKRAPPAPQAAAN